MTWSLTVAGCSGSIPGPNSPASCYLLAAGGFQVLLDLGSGALGAVQRYTGLDEIDAVWLSHLHADHCLDLCPYWVARSYAPGGPRPPIPVYGPEGTAHRMARAQGLAEDPGMTGIFSFVTLTPGTREIGPFRVTTALMNHPVPTFGFRIEHAGRVVTYSADTGESDELVRLARGADLLLCEASFLSQPGLPKGLHLTAAQAVEHASRAGAGRLVLTHLVPWNDPARTLAEASGFAGELSLAAPGQRFEF
jgi:ribonuclease BN (tRNA processing enzyme)